MTDWMRRESASMARAVHRGHAAAPTRGTGASGAVEPAATHKRTRAAKESRESASESENGNGGGPVAGGMTPSPGAREGLDCMGGVQGWRQSVAECVPCRALGTPARAARRSRLATPGRKKARASAPSLLPEVPASSPPSPLSSSPLASRNPDPSPNARSSSCPWAVGRRASAGCVADPPTCRAGQETLQEPTVTTPSTNNAYLHRNPLLPRLPSITPVLGF